MPVAMEPRAMIPKTVIVKMPNCLCTLLLNQPTAIKIIEAHNLNFGLGNVIKYVLRAGKKGDALQDLEKAKWYLEREITNLVICRDVNRYKSIKW